MSDKPQAGKRRSQPKQKDVVILQMLSHVSLHFMSDTRSKGISHYATPSTRPHGLISIFTPTILIPTLFLLRIVMENLFTLGANQVCNGLIDLPMIHGRIEGVFRNANNRLAHLRRHV